MNLSSEFQFPLQLVYLTSRTREGLFGSQWFCPQLESTILPAAEGALEWTMPSGESKVFNLDPERNGEYISEDRGWRAKVSAIRQVLRDKAGWEYIYAKGCLLSVESPSKRMLEFEWQGRKLLGVQFRDLLGNRRQLLLLAQCGDDKRISSFKLSGLLHRFAYIDDGRQQRLATWQPAIGELVKFAYQPDIGILSKVGTGNTEDPARVETFHSEFVKRLPSTAAEEAAAKKLLVNYWLLKDGLGSYSYGRTPFGNWLSFEVTITSLNGPPLTAKVSPKRGIVTTQQGDMQQKNYYYRAPGQRYDGKLRRTEVDGKIVQELRYDRKTGLLSEIVDAKGKSTYFDYDPNFRPSKRVDWEPQPIRVRYGNRKSSQVLAEYSYNDEGKVIAAKNKQGEVTRYGYTPRGEIAAITTPAGDLVTYSYDEFGRCNAVKQGEITTRTDFDEHGRVSAQTAADGCRTEFKYDADGLPTQVIANGKLSKEIIRDEFHRVIGEKDGLQRFSRNERDFKGNLLCQTAPNGSTTRYEYDSQNRRTAQIDGNGNRITFSYDAKGNLAQQTNALGNRQTWRHDPKSGNLLERTNGVQTIRQAYDKDGKLIALDYGDEQKLAIEYDAEGRQASVTGPQTTFTSRYNPAGQLVASQALHGYEDHTLSYRYNRRGQRSGLLISKKIGAVENVTTGITVATHYESLQQTEQTYDAQGKLSVILSNGSPTIAYRYDLAGRPIHKTYGSPRNGQPALTASLSYDSAGRLAGIQYAGGGLMNPLVLSYQWDAADQLSSRTWNGETLRYRYDLSGQLLSVTTAADQAVIESYRYDPAGNMTSKLLHGQLTAMTYNAANQLEHSYDLGAATSEIQAALPNDSAALKKRASAVISFQYDPAGRLLSQNAQPPSQYGWLDKVVQSTAADGTALTHTYWPDGQLAAISTANAAAPAETFLWDGLALLKRSNTLYVIEPHPSGGIPIASHPVDKPDQLTYHLNDLLGTTLATLGPDGLRFASLSSFGQPLQANASLLPAEATAPIAPASPLPTQPSLPSR